MKLLTSKVRNIIVNGEFRGVAIGCHSVARRTRSARRPGLRGGDAIRRVHALGVSRRRQIIGLTLSSHTLSCSTPFSSGGGRGGGFFRDDRFGGVIRPVYRPAPSRTPHGFLCTPLCAFQWDQLARIAASLKERTAPPMSYCSG
ncbi:MAG: hypothetical protein ACREFP_12350 [Acetobacteraceae bacterium]